MDKSAKTKLINDIENRLDDFFSGQSETAPSESRHSVEKLKSAVLSIDWEITDACLTDLIEETEALLPQFKDDPMTHALLRMLRALGRYIRRRKAQAHQDAIKRVMSVFASIELMMGENSPDEQLKKRIVAKEIQAFNTLRQNIEAQPSSAARPAPPPAENSSAAADACTSLGDNHFKKAMIEMEERLSTEVNALKSQLSALQRELDALRNA